MAVPRESSVGRPRGGFRGTWFWLVAIFAATVFWLPEAPRSEQIVGLLADQWLVVVALLIGWSIGWGLLGRILAAVAPDRSARSVHLLSGRTLMTVAAGLLLPLEMMRGRWSQVEPRELLIGFGLCAGAGFLWWLLIDMPRVAFWRFSRRPAPPLLSVANVAVLAGLVALAVVLARDVTGRLEDSPLREGVKVLMMIGAAAVSFTVFIEFPRAMLLRARTEIASGHRAHLAGALRTVADQAARAVPRVHAAPRPRAADQHGRIATPPTVVRRKS